MENQVTEDSCNYNSIGDIIRRYRDVTKMTQSELCFDLNNYLKEIGVDKYTVSQTSMAKYEAGNAIPDINVVRYLNDRILKTGIDVKSKVLYIVDELISITDVPIDDIEQLLRVKKKQQLIDFLRGHIAQSDNRLAMKRKNETFRLIVDELYDFPEEVHIDLNLNIAKYLICDTLNATALLLCYLIYNYIYMQLGNNLLYNKFRDWAAERDIQIPARSRVSKMDMVNLCETLVYHKEFQTYRMSMIKNFLLKLDLMFKQEDSDDKKLVIVSKITDSIRILAYFGLLTDNPERLDRAKSFAFKVAKSANIHFFIFNFRLLINDPLILMGFCIKLYDYKSLLNTVDELYEQLQTLLAQKGNISEFINIKAIQSQAKSIYKTWRLRGVDKKLKLFNLINSLQAVNEWDVKLST